MNADEPVIRLSAVSKQYRQRSIVADVNLDVAAGEVVGLIGPNGSGKTTILRIVAGLVQPTSGQVFVGGQDLGHLRDRVAPHLGVLFDPPGFLPQFTGFQNLRLLADLRRVVDAEGVRRWMQRLHLNPTDPTKVGAYSQGMIQRLGLVQALMENPRVLLLDEPTNALDPASVDLVADLIREQQSRGTAVVVASHHLEEVARVCTRVYKVDQGRLRLAAATDLKRRSDLVPR